MTERDERHDEAQRVVIRDKRRIDPATGAARSQTEQVWIPPGAAKGDPGAVPPGSATDDQRVDAVSGDAATWQAGQAPDRTDDARVAELTAQLSERTNDLQRITAEFANYRKRVERDRVMVADVATGSVLAALLPVLDDLDRAREHGDLTGAFKAVADQLDAVLVKLGLTTVGEPGDPFDPTLHEAVAHQTSADVTAPTCVAILRRGYAYRDRLLRPPLVAVADPPDPADLAPAAEPAEPAVEPAAWPGSGEPAGEVPGEHP